MVLLSCACTVAQVTYKPYLQLGDAGRFGRTDQAVIAWQTAEAIANSSAYRVEFGETQAFGSSAVPQGRVVDNYLATDPTLPVPPTASGPHVNYYAVLKGLEFDTTYFYRVTGPGLAGGFTSHFHTRKRSGRFSFLVQGDEGFFPAVPGSNPPRLADFEARIIHLMFNVHNLSFAGEPILPRPDLALNTGDNVYTQGAEGSYRDFWFPVWNSDTDSNDTGAPFIRSIPLFIVAGNHDIGGGGDRVNLLGGDAAGRFSGNTDGGDALEYFNNYYFPLNGAVNVDPYQIYNGDTVSPSGSFFQFKGITYTSPAAAEALRASTTVDSGSGIKRQIDHMSNYSFDYGNAHFLFLDANPHLFNVVLDGRPNFAGPDAGFPAYPSVLKNWIMNDLDASNQTWKFVVFHQPAFSSGNATLRNNQMRAVARILEDHGVNMVFNGHEHNYQRTLPLRATSRVAAIPATTAGPAVEADSNFDGADEIVPDGVLYLVEGAGGNRDFDGDEGAPRGSGLGVDQEDSATGTATLGPGLTFPNGPASWADINLTNAEMTAFLTGAGAAQKITTKFKAKVFSFADIVVDENKLTLRQITEPLLGTSSATAANPAPFGTDLNGKPLNDPIPDTLVDPATGNVVTPPAEGTSTLLDKFTIKKPELDEKIRVHLSAPRTVSANHTLTYTIVLDNDSTVSLNGAQVLLHLPDGVSLSGTSDNITQQGRDLVITLGRLAAGDEQTLQINTLVDNLHGDALLVARTTLRSSTALPVMGNDVRTHVRSHGHEHDDDDDGN
jgi:uncharacterized repeat protein (TIGR01451 family)